MKLRDFIRERRASMTRAPDNTEAMAQQFEKMGSVPPPPPPPNKKMLNNKIVGQAEEGNYSSPYTGLSETTDSPSPIGDGNPMLRDHIRSYKQHAMKQDKNKFDSKRFV